MSNGNLTVLAARDLSVLWFGLRLNAKAGELLTIPHALRDRFVSEFGPQEGQSSRWSTPAGNPFIVLDDDVAERLRQDRDAALERVRQREAERAESERQEQERLADIAATYEALRAAVVAAVEES